MAWPGRDAKAFLCNQDALFEPLTTEDLFKAIGLTIEFSQRSNSLKAVSYG